MKVLAYLSRAALAFVLLWCALIGLSYVIFPSSQSATIDTQRYKSVIFGTTPKWIAYGLAPLERPGPKIIVIGASNAREGLRPGVISHVISGQTIYNLSVDAANVTELQQTVSLVYDKLSASDRKDTTFVIGIWYGLFTSDESRWENGPTSIQVELSRYGLWRRGPSGEFRPVLSTALMPYAFSLLRPVLMFRHYYLKLIKDPAHQVRISIRDRLIAHDLRGPLARYLREQCRRSGGAGGTDIVRQWVALQHRLAVMGSDPSYPAEQLKKLVRLSRHIVHQGSKLVIVELPIAKWHASAPLPYYRQYQSVKAKYLDRIGALSGATIVDLTAFDSNANFVDDVHPTPGEAKTWSSALAKAMQRAESQSRSIVGNRDGEPCGSPASCATGW